MATENDNQQPSPIVVIDLGKKSRKKIKKLKRNEGELIDEVARATEMFRQEMGDKVEGSTLVPVVFVYRKKEKKRKNMFPFPFRL